MKLLEADVRKKTVWTILLLATVLVACGPTASPESASNPADSSANNSAATAGNNSATTILRFAVSGMDQNQYDSLIDAFEAENPDVHISTVSIENTLGTGPGGFNWPDDAYLRLAAAADVIAATATRQAVQQGALLDLTQFFESDPNLKPGSFYPGLLESMQWDGGTWSLPIEATYPLIYFDKLMFDAAGVAYPEPGWTWDDFLATAKALTIGSGDTVSQWGFVEPTFDPVTFVQAKAGLLFNADAYPPTARLDDAAVVEAVRWYTDLFRTYEVSPYSSSSGQGGVRMSFGNEGMRIDGNEAAMWFMAGDGRGFQMRFQGGPGQQQQTTTGAVPFPVSKPDDHTTPAVVDGLSVSAGTQKANLAWQWISFLAQQSAGQRGPFNAMSTGTVPALPSVAAAAGYWDNLDEDFSAALSYAIEHATIDTYDGSGYDTFRTAVVDVMDNGTAIETALADAQAEVEADIEADVAAAPTPVANLVVAEEEQEALNAGAVIINFGLSEGGGRFGQQSLSTLVDQFQAAHSDIIVEVDTPEGFRGQLDLADMAAEYDCFQALPNLNDDSIAAVVNIEPFLAADSSTGKEDFFPSVLQQFTYQGQLWGLPSSVTVSVMNYNKGLFDAAGLPYPSPDWTTSDFLDAAVALTKGEGESAQYGYAPSSFGVEDLVSIMDRLGADMLDESVDPPRLVFNSPSVVEAFRWYTSLATQYQVEPVFENTENFGGGERQRQTLINEGRVAMWMESGGGGFGFGMAVRGGGPEQETDQNVGFVPLPAGPNSAQGSGFQSVNGYFISAQTEARQACWTWITFLTEQPNVASGLPARQSVAESAEYRQRVGDEQADAYLASVNSGSQASFFQRISDEGNWLGFISFWLSDAYDRVISGEMTVEESLDAAQESIDAFRDCVIANDAFQDPETMMQCLSESGANAPGGIGVPRP
jgi:ABC-type glycerol-3-phosphate transport system substrate-binding protein